jgi:hypothetical protein
MVHERCRELKNRINKSTKSGASSWFSARKILFGKFYGKRIPGSVGVDGRIILKLKCIIHSDNKIRFIPLACLQF